MLLYTYLTHTPPIYTCYSYLTHTPAIHTRYRYQKVLLDTPAAAASFLAGLTRAARQHTSAYVSIRQHT